MLNFKSFIQEYLTPAEQKIVNKKRLKPDNDFHSHVIPKETGWSEIPIRNVLQDRIDRHLKKNPSIHGHWKQVDHKTVQSPDYTDPNGISRPGFKKPLISVIKSDPELLKDYNDAQNQANDSVDEYDPETNRRDTSDKQTRWVGKPLKPDSDRKIIVSNHPYAIQGKSSHLKPWRSCAKFGNSDFAASNLDADVENGGAVAYNVHKDETDPNNPKTATARIALQPFISTTSGHRVLRPAPKHYGEDDVHRTFHNSVSKWAEENFPLKRGEDYKLDPSVYQDDHSEKDNRIFAPLTDEEKKVQKQKYENKIKNGALSSDDLKRARLNGYHDESHDKAIINNPKTPLYIIKDLLYNNPDLHHRILDNPKEYDANPSILHRITETNPSTHEKILSHHKDKVTEPLLDEISEKSPELDRTLLTKFGDKLSHKAIANIARDRGPADHKKLLTDFGDRLNDAALTSIARQSSHFHKKLLDDHGHNLPITAMTSITRQSPGLHARILKDHSDKVETVSAANIALKSPHLHKKLLDLNKKSDNMRGDLFWVNHIAKHSPHLHKEIQRQFGETLPQHIKDTINTNKKEIPEKPKTNSKLNLFKGINVPIHSDKNDINEENHEGQFEPGLRSKAKRKMTRTADYSARKLKSLSGNTEIKRLPRKELMKMRTDNLKSLKELPDDGYKSLKGTIKGSKISLKLLKKYFKSK